MEARKRWHVFHVLKETSTQNSISIKHVLLGMKEKPGLSQREEKLRELSQKTCLKRTAKGNSLNRKKIMKENLGPSEGRKCNTN